MRTRNTLPIAAIVLMLVTTATAADRPPGQHRIYEHPDLDLQFSAAPGWQTTPRPGDEGTHELVDPESGIHVLLWYTSTEQDARRYLSKMSHMMDLELGSDTKSRTIGDRSFWLLDCPGTVAGVKAHQLLAVAASGKRRTHPRENNLYIVQVWCPRADWTKLERRMYNLLDSVRIADRVYVDGQEYRLYPETTTRPPELDSPYVTKDGREYVCVRTRGQRFAVVDVTVENGSPNDYANGEWGKGRQLAVDAEDFPILSATGLHDEAELDATKTITGLPVDAITRNARPGGYSGAGFVASDEDLLSVIRGDNRLVRRLGLTHPQLARPLFTVVNLLLRDLALFRRGEVPRYSIASMRLDEIEIFIEAEASKGWQESIFDDEVLGYWQIVMSREPLVDEKRYLQDRYGHLPPEQLADLKKRLFTIHTGEMVPFYIQKYGFYEGHTSYRADPIAVAVLFGVKSLSAVDAAVGGNLLEVLKRHHVGETR